MDYDLYLVIGLIVSVFSVPSVVSAISDSRTPRIAAITLIIGGGFVAYAASQKPNGYTLNEIPNVVVNVVGRYVN